MHLISEGQIVTRTAFRKVRLETRHRLTDRLVRKPDRLTDRLVRKQRVGARWRVGNKETHGPSSTSAVGLQEETAAAEYGGYTSSLPALQRRQRQVDLCAF